MDIQLLSSCCVIGWQQRRRRCVLHCTSRPGGNCTRRFRRSARLYSNRHISTQLTDSVSGRIVHHVVHTGDRRQTAEEPSSCESWTLKPVLLSLMWERPGDIESAACGGRAPAPKNLTLIIWSIIIDLIVILINVMFGKYYDVWKVILWYVCDRNV